MLYIGIVRVQIYSNVIWWINRKQSMLICVKAFTNFSIYCGIFQVVRFYLCNLIHVLMVFGCQYWKSERNESLKLQSINEYVGEKKKWSTFCVVEYFRFWKRYKTFNCHENMFLMSTFVNIVLFLYNNNKITYERYL